MPQIHEWQTRPLDEIYPVVFIDATHYSVRENGIVKKLAAYVILAINLDGHKNRRKRECKILARRSELLEKSRLEGYFDFVCRRFSADRISALHRSSSPQHAQICFVERSQGIKYPHAMKSWRTNWDSIVPIFKFSPTLRTVIYTTNAIESLNSTYRRLNRQRSIFPNDSALLKALFLATELATKKWTMPIQNWGLKFTEDFIYRNFFALPKISLT